MKRLGWFILLLVCIAITWLVSRSRPSKLDPLPPLQFPGDRIVRLYDVGDLFSAAIDDPEEPLIVSASNVGPPQIPGPAGGNLPSTPPTREQRRLHELTALITNGIDPASWRLGRGSIALFAHQLVIVQSRENHLLIADLLHELRANSPRHVRVEAIWAILKPEDLDRLLPPRANTKPAIIDPDALARLPAAVAWRGDATCLNGQQTRISCGKSRSIMGNLNAEIGDGLAGFSGKTQQLLDGAMLEITPSLDGDASFVLLDVHSEVTRIGPAPLPPIEIPAPQSRLGASSQIIKLDRLNLGVQTISTSVRAPTGATILIGGTIDPDAPPTDPKRLYLFVRATKTRPSR